MMRANRNPVGRPPKFRESSRPVTVTLPQRTLEGLLSIDSDRAKAIVKAVDSLIGDDGAALRQVNVVEMAPGVGLLIISPNKSLSHLPWLSMIEISPVRFLLVIKPGTAIEKVELGLIDLIEEARASAPQDLPMLKILKEEFSRRRRENKVSKAEVLLFDLER